MRIVHVSTYDVVGGAARAAHRLHLGLRRLGQDSRMFVSQRFSDDPSIVALNPSRGLKRRIGRKLQRRQMERSLDEYRSTCPEGVEPFHESRSPFGADIVEQLPECDVVNLHWVVDSFFDFESFFREIAARVPVVWTLHDMNPFTGGCHYDLGCGRFVAQCGACPQLGSKNANDLSFRVWQWKQQALSRIPKGHFQFVTPSRWLGQEVERSSLGGRFPVSVIPYGIDTDDFAPRDRQSGREVLGIPRSAKVLLFLADGLDNQRKGFGLLAEALAGLEDASALTLLSLGPKKPALEVKVPWIHVGAMKNDRILSMIYSLADLFVIPSLQDNLPNTVLESMACGTPVVGFDLGGIPDMVRPGKTGALVPAEDVSALRRAIVQLLADPAGWAQMSAECRRVVTEEYPLDLQAERYVELYKGTLSSVREGPVRMGLEMSRA